jgi:hypothetical protein
VKASEIENFIVLQCLVVLCLNISTKLLLTAVYDRMRADQKKFGKASWAAAAERMEKLQYAVSKETLQMMRAKEICLEQKKHALKEEVTKAIIKNVENVKHYDLHK